MCTLALPAIKNISGGQCPVISWVSAALSYCLLLLGPEHLGGHGDLATKIELAARESGKSPAEVADSVGDMHVLTVKQVLIMNSIQVLKSFEGKVMHTPGMPPIYDYDLYPQDVSYQWFVLGYIVDVAVPGQLSSAVRTDCPTLA
jgi:hypothetical protein